LTKVYDGIGKKKKCVTAEKGIEKEEQTRLVCHRQIFSFLFLFHLEK
jgi:hypothetical protein